VDSKKTCLPWWRGNYKCICKDCQIEYEVKIERQPERHERIKFDVSWLGKSVHEKIHVEKKINKDQRHMVGLNLLGKGVDRIVNGNSLLNHESNCMFLRNFFS
jgi:hypothetical protein